MIMAAALLALAACGGNGNKSHNHGTHVHEDGTVHENHATEVAARHCARASTIAHRSVHTTYCTY